MSFIERAFEPLYGKICWNVRKGIGSFLTFQFGEPHLRIAREPNAPGAHEAAGLERFLARRHVSVLGDWSLWIYCCDWKFFLRDALLGDCESETEEIQKIAADLDGQALTGVRVTSTSQTIFTFDLGARLETEPN